MKWIFEPGHTDAEFKVRHMMVSWVRGHFKNVHGEVDFDPAEPEKMAVKAELDATGIWSGEQSRDAHLRTPDFLDTEKYPKITFASTRTEPRGQNDLRLYGELTLHGITKEIALEVHSSGIWKTPFWEESDEGYVNRGLVNRIGFDAEATIDRFDFGVDWTDSLERGGLVVGSEVHIKLDVEALLESDLARIEADKRAA